MVCEVNRSLSAPVFTGHAFADFETCVASFVTNTTNQNYTIKKRLKSFSNKNFKICTLDGTEFVVRIPNTIALHLANKGSELPILHWAKRAGISLIEVIAFNEEKGYLLTKFLQGNSSSSSDFANLSNLKQALNLLHRLHTSKDIPLSNGFDPLKRYEVTAQEASKTGFHLPEEVTRMASCLKDHLSLIPSSTWRKAPCHNDPSPENFFRQDSQLYLHDWELASLNDPMWDLAHFSVIGSVEMEKICAIYPLEDPLAKEKIVFFQAFIFFNSVIWASLEALQPTSTLPACDVATLYGTFTAKLKAHLDSQPFQGALKTLKLGYHNMAISAVSPVLARSADAFPGFKLKTKISTLFLECQEHLLVLMRSHKEDQPAKWGIPGGKAEKDETSYETLTRELREETKITLDQKLITYHGHRYARIPGWDYIVHIYSALVDTRPVVVLDPKEHSCYEWVSIYAFKTMPLIRGQDEVFDVVYADRLWQTVHAGSSSTSQKTDNASSLVLRKGDKELIFDKRKRFVINLIGTSGSGKGTQGELLSQLFLIPNISAGDLFRDEFRNKTKLGAMVKAYDDTHYPAYLPDEVPTGMMARRLAAPDCQTGFILDGFPRTKAQGDVTREVFLGRDDTHIPLFMDVPESAIWERLPSRQICPDCGHQVRKFDENPFPGYCPIDGAKGKMVSLEHRAEDTDRTKTERRLHMFAENKDVILSTMAQRDLVTTFALDNTIPPREVLHRLSTTIQKRLDTLYANRSVINRGLSPSSVLMLGVLASAIVGGAILLYNKRK